MNKLAMLGLVLALSTAAGVHPAKAWYDSDGNWHNGRIRSTDETRVVLRDSDRVFLQHYIEDHSAFCGFNDLRQGCKPRPEGAVFYHPGSVLPDTVNYTPLPDDVASQLAPAPEGEIYVRANDNVYLINRRDRSIVDAIDLF